MERTMVGGKLEDWRGVKEGVSSDPQNNLNGITLGHYGTHKNTATSFLLCTTERAR